MRVVDRAVVVMAQPPPVAVADAVFDRGPGLAQKLGLVQPKCCSIWRNTAVVPSPTPIVPIFEHSMTVTRRHGRPRRAAVAQHQRGQPACRAAAHDDRCAVATWLQPALRCPDPRPFRQPVAMGGQKVVRQVPDLVEVQFGPGVRVQHRGVIDVLGVFGQQRLHRQVLHVDVGAHQRDQLRRDVAHDGRLQARCDRPASAPRPRSLRAVAGCSRLLPMLP